MQIDIKLHKNDLPDEIKLDDKKSLAIDCEFSGLNVNRDKLYLVQISTGNNDAHIVQLNRDNYNAPNLKKILESKKVEKIFHFARADIAFIKKYLNIRVENVSCTKIMSKLARSYSDKHGLKEKQLKYCASDVIYLHKIHSTLKEILIRENRYELYSETIKFIYTRVELDLALFAEDIWSH